MKKVDLSNVSRRNVLAGGVVLGLGAMLGRSAFAAAPLSIAYSNKSLDYYFFVIQEESVKRAVQALSGKFQATNASFDTTTQLGQWQSLMLSQPTAIISDPIDSQAIVSAIKRYNQRKIPVGIIDTPADGGDVAITVSFDNFKGGVMAAEEIVKRLVAKYGSPKGTVLNCFGALASVAWRLRKEGMDSVFAKYPEIKYLARPTEGQLDKMQSVTLSTLSEFPDLDAVHAPSDSPSRGIAAALKQKDRWKKVGEKGQGRLHGWLRVPGPGGLRADRRGDDHQARAQGRSGAAGHLPEQGLLLGNRRDRAEQDRPGVDHSGIYDHPGKRRRQTPLGLRRGEGVGCVLEVMSCRPA